MFIFVVVVVVKQTKNMIKIKKKRLGDCQLEVVLKL